MSKRLLMVIGMVIWMFTMTACADKTPRKEEINSETVVADEDKQKEDVQETSKAEESSQSVSEKISTSNGYWDEITSEAATIKMGDKVTVDGMVEFSAEESYWGEELIPLEPKDVSYDYVEGEEGYVYLICRGKVKNLSSEEIFLSDSLGLRHDSLATLVLVNDSDLYCGRWYVGEDSISHSLAAGEEAVLYIAALVPEEIQDTCSKAEMFIGFPDAWDKSVWPMFGELNIEEDSLSYEYLLEITLP